MGWAVYGIGWRVSLMTPKFLSRGVLTELISLYWLLGPS